MSRRRSKPSIVCDRQLARETRVRLWAEHLELDEPTVAGLDVRTLVDEHWRPIAQLAMPGVSRRARRFLGPLEELIDDG